VSKGKNTKALVYLLLLTKKELRIYIKGLEDEDEKSTN
jgi:hypothetical protein